MIIETHPAAEDYKHCTRCPLCSTRECIVLGVGNHHADVMILGDGPGPTEDERGLPFVGQSGVLLNKMLKLLGWKRDDLFLDNICACWPCRETEEQRLVSRKPAKEEMLACRPRIMETIRQIDPLLLIVLGGAALYGLTGDTTSITRAREDLFFVHVPGVYKMISYPVIPTFHPSYVLRHGERENLGNVDGDSLPIKGPDSPMSLFKKDMVYAKSFANTLRKKYGEG